MKILYIILGIVIVSIVTTILVVKNCIDRLITGYSFYDFNINTQNILNQLKTTKEVLLNSFVRIEITNPSFLRLVFKDVDLELYYKGVMFAKLLKKGDMNLIIDKHKTNVFRRNVKLIINKDTFPILGLYISKQVIPIKVKFSGKIFGLKTTINIPYDYQP